MDDTITRARALIEPNDSAQHDAALIAIAALRASVAELSGIVARLTEDNERLKSERDDLRILNRVAAVVEMERNRDA